LRLGVIFTCRCGKRDRECHSADIAGNNLFLLILANCVGMTLFTIVMGNSFAAFPGDCDGVLVPLIIRPFGSIRQWRDHYAHRRIQRHTDVANGGEFQYRAAALWIFGTAMA
jgi:hypothetical protein